VKILNEQELIGMPPEELGARMIPVLRDLSAVPRWAKGVNLTVDAITVASRLLALDLEQDHPSIEEIREAVTEAWAWLEAQGLLVPMAPHAQPEGWKRLSRRALRFLELDAFVPYTIARRLDQDMLNPRIRARVWATFIRGEFDVAAYIAMKEVEIAVREASGYGNDKYGVGMMREAFHPENGPLTDRNSEKAEREARSALFAGAIGAHKNPLSHRNVNLDDATEAIEIVLLANHLLRIVERQTAINKKA
jgi:uncharacterized protein (TIGR02391 family)